MPTLIAKNNPGSRLDAGAHVLEAARGVDTRAIKKRLAAFASTHKAYVSADDLVTKAANALRAQQMKVADCDVDQDEAVDALAVALVTDGASRTQPFKALGFASPSTIKELGYAREAKEVLRLVKVASKGKPAKATAAALKRLEATARAVEASLVPIVKLEEAARAARTRRESLGLAWETAFAALKHAVRFAEDDGARGLFDALFRIGAPRRAPKANGIAVAPPPPPPAVS